MTVWTFAALESDKYAQHENQPMNKIFRTYGRNLDPP